MEIELDQKDHGAILAYKEQLERVRGYNGQCFVSVSRLSELYMKSAYIVATNAIRKSSLESKLF